MHPALKTSVCDLLGIEKPIFQAGMGFLARSDLAAAVSQAGGLGIIGAAFLTLDQFREEIHKVKDMTDKPFGVDILFATYGRPSLEPKVEEFTAEVRKELDIAFEAGVPVLASGLGNPAPVGIPVTLFTVGESLGNTWRKESPSTLMTTSSVSISGGKPAMSSSSPVVRWRFDTTIRVIPSPRSHVPSAEKRDMRWASKASTWMAMCRPPDGTPRITARALSPTRSISPLSRAASFPSSSSTLAS